MVKSQVIYKDYSKDAERTALVSGENLAHMFGKIARWYTDISWVGHTHTEANITDFGTYAGASTKGGAATSANKLNIGSSDIGSETKPVYFNATTGKPVACAYSLNASVPANAVFTDINVKQSPSTANESREVLFAGNTGNTETTGTVGKSNKLSFNPNTGALTATSFSGSVDASNLTGSIDAGRLPTTSVTSGSYGPAAGGTLAHGGTFDVAYVTVDKYGRLTAASTKTFTLPAQYVHPTYTSKSSGLYKITVDSLGHVSGTAAVTAVDLPAHSHILSLAADTGTSSITLSANTKYKLTAGGSTYVFTTPADTNTTYSAGTGLALDGTTFNLYMPRVTKDCNEALPGMYKVKFEEFSDSSTNIPSAQWYHITTMEGEDSRYATQLALGMTTTRLFYRNYSSSSWSAWKEVSFSDHTHNYAGSLTPGGDANRARQSNNCKVDVTNASTSTAYGVVFVKDPETTEDNTLRKTNDFRINHFRGAANTEGITELVLGNNIAKTSANNSSGHISFYNSNGKYTEIVPNTGSSGITITLPSSAGTLALVGDNNHAHNYIPNTQAGLIAAINLLSIGESTPTDDCFYITQENAAANNNYYRRKHSALWDYINSKISHSNTGSGNAVTSISYSNGVITATKGSTFASSTHTHLEYLPLTGGTMTGDLSFASVTSTEYPAVSKQIAFGGSTDGGQIFFEVAGADKGCLVIQTTDDPDAKIVFRNKVTSGGTRANEITITDGVIAGNGSGLTNLTANKLNTNAGGQIDPVYFSNGVPVKCKTVGDNGYFTNVAIIASDGVMEIGKYIDMHLSNGSSNDYDYRLTNTSTSSIEFSSRETNNTLKLYAPNGYTRLSFQTAESNKAYTASGITVYPLTTSGSTMTLDVGGNVVIGGGEAASTLYNNDFDGCKTNEHENLYLGADASIVFVSNVQDYANRVYMVWENLGCLRPSSNNTLSIGRADYYWNKAYISQILGRGTSGMWISARDNAIVRQSSMINGSAYFPVISAKTKLGEWSIGTLGPNSENFYISYTTDANYSAGTNNSNPYYISKDGWFSGTAAKADVWTTARTITIGSTGKSVNGSGNVSWSLSEIGAAATSHSHSNYLPQATPTSTPDLNTYTTTGIYHIGLSSTNAPVTQHSTVYVEAGVGTPYQLFKPDNLDTTWYTRHKVTDGWSEWVALKLTDTVYTHPTYTSKASGLYKITVDGTGHISGTAAVTASDLPAHTHNYVPNTIAGVSAAITLLDVGDDTPVDNCYYITQTNDASSNTYYRRKHSSLWTYIKGKTDSVYSAIGHTHSSITGPNKHDAAVPTSTVGTGVLTLFYNVDNTSGNMPKANNANAIIQLNKHAGEYDSQLGFSSDGNIYYRSANGSAFTTSSPWKQLAWKDDRLGANSDGSYWGMASPSNDSSVWIRTTSLGIIPYQSGAAGSGHQSIGTSTWYFSNAYIDTVHGNLDGKSTYTDYLNIVATNEIRFNASTKPSCAMDLYIGYTWSDGNGDAKINSYIFQNGNRTLTKIQAASIYLGNTSGTQGSITLCSSNKQVFSIVASPDATAGGGITLPPTSGIMTDIVYKASSGVYGALGKVENTGCIASLTAANISSHTSRSSSTQSFGGTYTIGGTWYNMLSIRHRNGSDDGGSYGFYLRNSLTSSSSLVYNQQYNSSSWRGEATIVDSLNLSSYAVPNTADGLSTCINKLSIGESTPVDNDYYVAQYAGGGTGVTSYHRRLHSALFSYINSKLYKILWSGSTSCTARSSTTITLTTAIAANKYRFIKIIWNVSGATGVSEIRADTLNVINNVSSASGAATVNIIQFTISSDGTKLTVGPGTTTITVLQIAGVYPL